MEPSPEATLGRGDVFIVGLGASAGGLEALERFFDRLPPTTRMAFVVVQHLSPDFKSLMNDILSRRTAIPVHVATEGVLVEPNAIYLNPPKKQMIISEGRLLLADKRSALSNSRCREQAPKRAGVAS